MGVEGVVGLLDGLADDPAKGEGDEDRKLSSFNDEIEDMRLEDISRAPGPGEDDSPLELADAPDVSRDAKKAEPTRLGKNGVLEPLVPSERVEGGCNASLDACKRRLVVPSAFVCDDRAEQTKATREFGMYDLGGYQLHPGLVWWRATAACV